MRGDYLGGANAAEVSEPSPACSRTGRPWSRSARGDSPPRPQPTTCWTWTCSRRRVHHVPWALVGSWAFEDSTKLQQAVTRQCRLQFHMQNAPAGDIPDHPQL